VYKIQVPALVFILPLLKLSAAEQSQSMLPALHMLNVTWQITRSPPTMQGSAKTVGRCRPMPPLTHSGAIAKVFEKLVHLQLYAYLQEHNILHRAQSGFRPDHCTQDVIVASVDDWRRGLDNNYLVGVVLVDISRAFDSISHDLLLCKMVHYGIRGEAKRWFQSYLSERKRVMVDNEVSTWSTVRVGVPQAQFWARCSSHCS